MQIIKHSSKTLYHSQEKGRSMVEMLGVLAIIGVLSVGGIAGYSKAMNKFKINKTADQISMLVANIKTNYSTQGNYVGLDNAQAIKIGVVPNDMYKSTDTSAKITNPFGGNVTIMSSGRRQAGDNEAFLLVYSGLTSEACVTIATSDWNPGRNSGLVTVAAGYNVNTAYQLSANVHVDQNLGLQGYVGSNNTAGAVPGGTIIPTPMPLTTAIDACHCTSSTCEVSWKYY